MEKSIYLRIIEYGLKFPNGFKYQEFIEGLSLESWETKIVNKYIDDAYQNAYNLRVGTQVGQVETPFVLIENGNSNHFMDPNKKYLISFDAHFKYIDYQELKFARETAKEARKYSMIAIGISIFALLASIVVPILISKYFTQEVKLDSSQLDILQQTINNR